MPRAGLTLLAIASVAAALVVPPSTNGAGGTAFVVLGYPYGHRCPAAGYADLNDQWNMTACNCTSYAAWALAANGRRIDWFRAGEMDAYNWPVVARAAGIPEGRVAKPGAVAAWPRLSPPYGHLAFVTAVHRDGTFDVVEYNLLRRFRFDARYRVSPAGATFVYVPLRR